MYLSDSKKLITADEKIAELRQQRDKLDAQLATERQKVRALTATLESICEEWGHNYNANPIGAGQKMETLATKMLESLEDAT